MPGAADEASLIARIAAGDAVALRELFARHRLRVYRFILRLVQRAAVAEELTNDVFLEVWWNAGRFEGSASALTWMLAIARHRAVSSLRKRREESWDEKAAAALADTADDPEVAAQKLDKGRMLRRCLDELSPEHRGIIDLVYYHEMSIAEVAEVLQVPENTVKTRLFYARKRLSQLLKQAGIDRGWP
jgi:RNA polymerase sigma-70 factor, ECF subfamily